MRACQRESVTGMIERGRLPDAGIMALSTRMADLIARVIRTRRAIVCGLMAAVTIRRQSAAILAIGMALPARDRGMRTGQGEGSARMVEG